MVWYEADNCKILGSVTEQPSDLSNYLIDDRHGMYICNSSMDIVEYLNYVDSIRTIAQTHKVGKYRYMLDLGYIPVCMAPVYLVDFVYSVVVPKLTEQSIPFIHLPASSFSQPNYSGPRPDVWVSKMDVYKVCGCKPENVTVKRLLEVLKCV